jgi:hypothetical protein
LSARRGLGLVALLVLTATRVLAAEPAEHTVEWYRTHEQVRENVLRVCQNDHTYDPKPDCRNALSASHAAAADDFGQAAAGKTDPEADPAYYGHNGPLIAMTLSMCSRHAAPEPWCRAARSASTNQSR